MYGQKTVPNVFIEGQHIGEPILFNASYFVYGTKRCCSIKYVINLKLLNLYLLYVFIYINALRSVEDIVFFIYFCQSQFSLFVISFGSCTPAVGLNRGSSGEGRFLLAG